MARIVSGCSGERHREDGDWRTTLLVAVPLVARFRPSTGGRKLSGSRWRGMPATLTVRGVIFARPSYSERPFWRDKISTDWWMLDAFDGCCVYDEGTRFDYGPYGLLAFLIAGNAALRLVNDFDELIEQSVPGRVARGTRPRQGTGVGPPDPSLGGDCQCDSWRRGLCAPRRDKPSSGSHSRAGPCHGRRLLVRRDAQWRDGLILRWQATSYSLTSSGGVAPAGWNWAIGSIRAPRSMRP